jgi:hypothetical protein
VDCNNRPFDVPSIFCFCADAAAAAAAALQDNYTFAQCKRVLPVSAVRGLGVPLPPAEVETVEENLTWDEIQVGCAVLLVTVLQHIVRLHWMMV